MDMFAVYEKYKRAFEERSRFEPVWDDCRRYSQPGAADECVFDSTAANAVDNLASSLLAQLTPPWSRWFGLSSGSPEAAGAVAEAERVLQSHMERSNFYVEAHQCYLDLVTFGTAVMLFEEAPVGWPSAFKFSAVPFEEVALGSQDEVFRRTVLSRDIMRAKFPSLPLPEGKDSFTVVESSAPRMTASGPQGFGYMVFADVDGSPLLISEGVFGMSPFIVFRWMKMPSEVYGRSPMMKALPDVKTANKVVELVLKNASMSVSGVWMADDDGVMNLDNITLSPGTIIPKAVGSSGLTPLRTGADFNVSQLVLSELRSNIERCLLADRLSDFRGARMTATEVVERSESVSRVLGATYGRLQSEFLTMVILRAVGILKRRGEIGPLFVNGREVDLKYQSPLAGAQAVRDAENVLGWIRAMGDLGGGALERVDRDAVAKYLSRVFGISGDFTADAASPGAGSPSTGPED
ncbi:MAG: head-tail connector protein [Rickettsiales bacterium]|jgi:hypothetical protein|nr:head-tail connector protein [Rickettsiales bacterium]